MMAPPATRASGTAAAISGPGVACGAPAAGRCGQEGGWDCRRRGSRAPGCRVRVQAFEHDAQEPAGGSELLERQVDEEPGHGQGASEGRRGVDGGRGRGGPGREPDGERGRRGERGPVGKPGGGPQRGGGPGSRPQGGHVASEQALPAKAEQGQGELRDQEVPEDARGDDRGGGPGEPPAHAHPDAEHHEQGEERLAPCLAIDRSEGPYRGYVDDVASMEGGAGGHDLQDGNGGVPLRAEQDSDDFWGAQRHRDARGYGQERRQLHAVEIDGAETVDSLLAFCHSGKQHPREEVSKTVRRPGHAPCLGVVSEERRAEAVCKGEVGAPPGDRCHQGGEGESRPEPEQLGGFAPREGRAQRRRAAGDDRRREQRVPREKAAYQRPGAESIERERDRDQPVAGRLREQRGEHELPEVEPAAEQVLGNLAEAGDDEDR